MVELIYIDQKQTMHCTAFDVPKTKHDTENAIHEVFLCIITKTDKLSEIKSGKVKSLRIKGGTNYVLQ